MPAVARSRSTDQRYYGVAEAIVVDNIDPDKLGRVEVTFPWFDAETKTWARVGHLYAGGGYGAFFIPEVGDEVLVGFVHGDMRAPIVLGGLYNGVDNPPSDRQSSKDEKLIRTKAGHRILFDDSGGKEKVRVETKGGHSLELSDEGRKATLTTSGGHEIACDDGGEKVTIQCAGGPTVTLDGNGNSITVKGATVTLDAMNVKLGGAGAAQPLVLGTLFMTLFNVHTHTTTAPGTPTSPPLTPMTPAQLSTVSKTM